MPKEIIIITNYFPPEKGAAANRIKTLANSLVQNNYNTTVVCPLPNYPNGKVFEDYKKHFFIKNIKNKLTVYRLWIYASNSKNKFVRLFSMLTFSINIFFFLLLKKTPKKIIIQCSPLFVGFFAVLASKIKNKTIILNVSDLWPLAGLEMKILKKGFYYRILEYIEQFNYKNSKVILCQSEEIITHINKHTKETKTFLYRNYPLINNKNNYYSQSNNKIKIVYAGLLGIAQGILDICKEIKLPENTEFHIYGDGPESKEIELIAKRNKNIIYHGIVDRNILHKKIPSYTVTLIPLKTRIYGSVPSKIFEYAHTGIPIVYLSNGEGSEIVKKYNLGITLNAMSYKELNTTIKNLSIKKIILPSRESIINTAKSEFNFESQFDKFIKKIENI